MSEKPDWQRIDRAWKQFEICAIVIFSMAAVAPLVVLLLTRIFP